MQTQSAIREKLSIEAFEHAQVQALVKKIIDPKRTLTKRSVTADSFNRLRISTVTDVADVVLTSGFQKLATAANKIETLSAELYETGFLRNPQNNYYSDKYLLSHARNRARSGRVRFEFKDKSGNVVAPDDLTVNSVVRAYPV